MNTAALKLTLLYMLKIFVVLVPLYYVTYGFLNDAIPNGERLQTSLIYGGLVTLFLGVMHYFFRSTKISEGADAGARKGD